MRTETVQQPVLKNSIVFGALGGLLAGVIMMAVPIYSLSAADPSFDLLPKALGIMLVGDIPNVIVVGISAHLATSIAIGIIFGAVVSKIAIFRISGYSKGVCEGVAAGMIAFFVISIPITLFVMGPMLPGIVAQAEGVSLETAQAGLQQNMAINMGMSVLRHIVYGAVLGTVVTVLVLVRANLSGYRNPEQFR